MSDYFAAQQTSNGITVSNSMNDVYLQTEENEKEKQIDWRFALYSIISVTQKVVLMREKINAEFNWTLNSTIRFIIY